MKTIIVIIKCLPWALKEELGDLHSTLYLQGVDCSSYLGQGIILFRL